MHSKKRSSVLGVLVPVVLLVVILSLARSLICTAGQIYAKQQEYDALQARVVAQLAENEELSRQLEKSDLAIIEQAARSQHGYVGANERVFVDMTGK